MLPQQWMGLWGGNKLPTPALLANVNSFAESLNTICLESQNFLLHSGAARGKGSVLAAKPQNHLASAGSFELQLCFASVQPGPLQIPLPEKFCSYFERVCLQELLKEPFCPSKLFLPSAGSSLPSL